MAHDVRIIPIVAKPHLDSSVKLWHGDSRGWWEGDTLVIETTNYSEASSTSPRTIEKVNIERLTRIGDNALQYQFTSNDQEITLHLILVKLFSMELPIKFTSMPVMKEIMV